MVKFPARTRIVVLAVILSLSGGAWAQSYGSIRGSVFDDDFDVPLAGAQVRIAELGRKAVTDEQGNYLLAELGGGVYTLVFSREGFARQVLADVAVAPGRMTEINVRLQGEFAEMEEFVVQDIQLAGSSEAALLQIRFESPQLMDSIGADIMSRAGAGDAGDALKLVAGATVQDGKYAVIRGLPDRYVSSQMNGVRLPTADADKRAVELDQFPSEVIESIQVSKTFTPDQQGDASGGAVNVVLKGIPEQAVAKVSAKTGYNTETTGRDDFVTYHGGGVGAWGIDDGGRDVQTPGRSWGGAAGVSFDDAPMDYEWSAAVGGSRELGGGLRFGGFGSFFYERDSQYADKTEDAYWLSPQHGVIPQLKAGTLEIGDFYTNLFDIRQGRQGVKWGGLGVLGLEADNHALTFLYMTTRAAEDTATLSEDRRGKIWARNFYGPDNEDHPDPGQYIRYETLRYVERITETMQLHGRHTLPIGRHGLEDWFMFGEPELDWTLSASSAGLNEPDKRMFSTAWAPGISTPFFTIPPSHNSLLPADSASLGWLQRVWKEINEDSRQLSLNLKLPFEQWTADEGYVKVGLFLDDVHREYDQDSYSNFEDPNISWDGALDEFWSEEFPSEEHIIQAGNGIDVDYEGDQKISAWYAMADLPLCSWFNIVGGVRVEKTELSTVTNVYDGSPIPTPVVLPGSDGTVNPIAPDGTNLADVDFRQTDVLPSIGFVFSPLEQIKLRGSYAETVARQTFKELTPIKQQEYAGASIFIGNPELQMSSLRNYDLRLDYVPSEGSLISASWFYKDITDPIEYVQRAAGFSFTTPVNFTEGELTGVEVEFRQQLGKLWDSLEGLGVGANATFIKSEVTLPNADVRDVGNLLANAGYPLRRRDMLNAPEYLYNLFLTYDLERTGTKLGLFYTVRGDTLVVGEGTISNGLLPAIYEREYGTLNFSLSQRLGEHFSLKFQAKNLLNPAIDTVYRSDYLGGDVTRSSYRKGLDFSLSLTAEF